MTYEDGTNSVPKRRQVQFIRRGIAQKKEYKNPVLFAEQRVLLTNPFRL
jgi:hypothetical protein